MFKRSFRSFLFFMITSLMACGTGVGNPVKQDITPTDAQFNELIQLYDNFQVQSLAGGIDCGSYSIENTPEQVNAGRQCIRDALAACAPAKYLLDQVYSDTDRFTSFVWIDRNDTGSCDLSVHTFSTHTATFYGKYSATCSAIESDEIIEFACQNLGAIANEIPLEQN